MVNDPSGARWGGTVAAPAVKAILAASLEALAP